MKKQTLSIFFRETPILLLTGLAVFAAIWLRLAYLGYSDFQGDEIKALCQLAEGQNLGDFLLSQRKGPVQFLITCLYGLGDPDFSSELGLRLPFAIASVAAVGMFYLLGREFFSTAVSLYAALLLATNGVIVALGRIVQYQSISILGAIVGVYGLVKAVNDENWKVKGLYLGFSAAMVGVLAHFDGVYGLLPMAYLLYLWRQKYQAGAHFGRDRAHLIAALAVFGVPLLLFYVPFVLKLGEYQLGYWENRITTATNSNTWLLFRFYNPGPIVFLYLALIAAGITRLRWKRATIVLLLWGLPPFLVMEGVMSNAGTHFYTYLLPLFFIAALGLEAAQKWLERWFKSQAGALIRWISVGLFGFVFGISHFILVDHTPEYPWQPRVVLGMTFPGGDLAGTFGFPYSRNWRAIARHITQNYDSDILLATNEKGSLTTFYFPEDRPFLPVHEKYSPELAIEKGLLVLWVESPQSWIDKILGLRQPQWQANFAPAHEFRDPNGRLNATLYFLSRQEIEAWAQP